MKKVEMLTRITGLSSAVQSVLHSSIEKRFPEWSVCHLLDVDKAKSPFIAHNIPVDAVNEASCQLVIMVFARDEDHGYDMAARVVRCLSKDLKEKNTYHGITPDYDPDLDGFYHMLDFDIAFNN